MMPISLDFILPHRSYGQNVESAPFLTLGLLRGTLYRKTCVVSDSVLFRKRLKTDLFSLALNIC